MHVVHVVHGVGDRVGRGALCTTTALLGENGVRDIEGRYEREQETVALPAERWEGEPAWRITLLAGRGCRRRVLLLRPGCPP
jgi:hypothetical protein